MEQLPLLRLSTTVKPVLALGSVPTAVVRLWLSRRYSVPSTRDTRMGFFPFIQPCTGQTDVLCMWGALNRSSLLPSAFPVTEITLEYPGNRLG